MCDPPRRQMTLQKEKSTLADRGERMMAARLINEGLTRTNGAVLLCFDTIKDESRCEY